MYSTHCQNAGMKLPLVSRPFADSQNQQFLAAGASNRTRLSVKKKQATTNASGATAYRIRASDAFSGAGTVREAHPSAVTLFQTSPAVGHVRAIFRRAGRRRRRGKVSTHAVGASQKRVQPAEASAQPGAPKTPGEAGLSSSARRQTGLAGSVGPARARAGVGGAVRFDGNGLRREQSGFLALSRERHALLSRHRRAIGSVPGALGRLNALFARHSRAQ